MLAKQPLTHSWRENHPERRKWKVCNFYLARARQISFLPVFPQFIVFRSLPRLRLLAQAFAIWITALAVAETLFEIRERKRAQTEKRRKRPLIFRLSWVLYFCHLFSRASPTSFKNNFDFLEYSEKAFPPPWMDFTSLWGKASKSIMKVLFRHRIAWEMANSRDILHVKIAHEFFALQCDGLKKCSRRETFWMRQFSSFLSAISIENRYRLETRLPSN